MQSFDEFRGDYGFERKRDRLLREECGDSNILHFSIISLILNIILITKREKVLKVLKQNPTKSRRDGNEITRHLMRKRDLIVLNQSACLLVSDIIIMIGMDSTRDQVFRLLFLVSL